MTPFNLQFTMMRDMLDAVKEMVMLVDRDGRCLYANREAASGLKEDHEAMAGRTLVEMGMPPEEDAKIRQAFTLAYDSKISSSLKLNVKRPTCPRYFEISISPLSDEKGEVLAALCIVREVTQQAELEIALKTRARQQEAAANLGRMALAEKNLNALFQSAATIITDTLRVEFSKIDQFHPEQNILIMQSGVGWNEDYSGTTKIDSHATFQK